jgi:hypothetical protein
MIIIIRALSHVRKNKRGQRSPYQIKEAKEAHEK